MIMQFTLNGDLKICGNSKGIASISRGMLILRYEKYILLLLSSCCSRTTAASYY